MGPAIGFLYNKHTQVLYRFFMEMSGDRPLETPSQPLEVGEPPSRAGRNPLFWGFAVLLVLVVGLAFLPALGNEFVKFDDDENFVENMDYRGLSLSHLGWAWTTFLLGVYQPIAWMLLEVQYVLSGTNPWGYHLASILMQCANSVMVFVLIRTLMRLCEPERTRGNQVLVDACAALMAGLYALHPLRVEVVAWVSCQPYLPCSLFYLSAVLAYLQANPSAGESKRTWLIASWGLFVLALLSKAVAVSLPGILLILDIYPLRRFGRDRESTRRIWREKLLFLAPSVLFMILAVLAKNSNESLRSMDALDLWPRIAQSCYGIWFYLVKTIAPFDLVAYYPLPRRAEFTHWSFFLSLLATLVVSGLAFRWRRARPGFAIAWVAYIVALAPNLGIIQIGNQLVADRYSYVPLLPWMILAAVGLFHLLLLIVNERLRLPALSFFVVPLVALFILTWNQCRTWRTTEALWANVLSHGDTSSPVPYFNLGADFARRQDYRKALAFCRQALRLDPTSPDAHNLVGVALDAQGKADEAFSKYAEAVRLEPVYPDARNNLGSALARRGKLREAVAHFTEAVRQRPNFALANKNLGLALSRLGRVRQAITYLETAVYLAPEDADLWQSLGVALAKTDRMDEAITAFFKANALRPGSESFERNLGLALERRDRLDEAIQHYAEAVKLGPQHRENRLLLASALALRGRFDEAEAQFDQILLSDPEDHETRQAREQLRQERKRKSP